MGVCYDFPDCPVAVLAGAATLPSFRSRGVYRQLLARRLRDTRERGMTGAVTQAVAETSAPVFRRSGFIDLCEIRTFEWHPARPGGDDDR